MHSFEFNYEMYIEFSNFIEEHSFALKCKPIYNNRQRYHHLNISVEPFCNTWETTDSFGNHVISGYCKPLHKNFKIKVSGFAEINNDKDITDQPLHIYSYPSSSTKIGSNLEKLFKSIEKKSTLIETLDAVSSQVNACMEYSKDSTHLHTTAEEALVDGLGVCQDFTHVMIACTRYLGYPSRYIAGLSVGEGETHAWLEVFDNEKWVGYDPTHHCMVDDNYLKISQGRDAKDCIINKGLFKGLVTQTMNVQSNMTLMYGSQEQTNSKHMEATE